MLILALAALGLIAVHLLGKRTTGRVQALDWMREGRRQQVITFAYAVRWGANVLIVV